MDAEQHSDLLLYRASQRELAIERDGGLCQICAAEGIHREADDVHHVYGRGHKAGDWREDYKNLMCVCRECHPMPIFSKPAGENLRWVEEILEKINET